MKKFKKFFTALTAAALCVSMLPTAALAADTGWKQTGNTWSYYENNQKVTGWDKIGNKWYYFDNSGIMKTGWQTINQKKYYFQSYGAMKTSWLKQDDKWYYFDGSGSMAAGWRKINNKWYYFYEDGSMAKYWRVLNNESYYFEESGAMKTGWLNQHHGLYDWYYFKPSGAMAIGCWQKINNNWYYFNSNDGGMITEWHDIDGKTYYFNESGAMVTGEAMIHGTKCLFEPSGAFIKGGYDYVPGPTKGDASDVMGQSGGNAGEFAEVGTISSNRKVWNGTTDASVIRAELNSYCGSAYGFRFFDSGIARNRGAGEDGVRFVTDGNRVGMNIISWRHSYSSDTSVNAQLNMILEALWYMSGDREFAHALWSWNDAANINGYANTTDYGFTDVLETANGGVISMNGIEVELEFGNGDTTIWFEK